MHESLPRPNDHRAPVCSCESTPARCSCPCLGCRKGVFVAQAYEVMPFLGMRAGRLAVAAIGAIVGLLHRRPR
jgi:hypothetical protein